MMPAAGQKLRLAYFFHLPVIEIVDVIASDKS
jgi:hypothetical protein